MESTDLLADIEAVGENRDLLRQSLIVERDPVCELLNCGAELVALFHEAHWCPLGDTFHGLLDQRDTLTEIRGEPRALRSAHSVECGNGALHHGNDLCG